MRELYELDRYAEKNPSWHEEDAPWKAKHIEQLIREHDLPRSAVCEVGCGTGDILLCLENAFPEATLCGFDISPHAIARAAAKPAQRISFRLENPLASPELRFDIALAIDVLEHVEDCFQFAKDLKRLAAYKIFHIPLDLSAQSVLRARPIMNLREGVGHIHYFFKDTALALLRDCGYELLAYRYTASRLELPNQALSSLAMRWPRRLAFKINDDLAVRLLGGYSLLVLAR